MPKKYDTEDSVKQALHVQSFSQLPTALHQQLAEMLSDIEPEVAEGIINKIPFFIDFGNTTISTYTQICDHFLEQNSQSQKAAIQSYQIILDKLSQRLDADISEDERKAITKDMIDVANSIASLDERNKDFLEKMAETALKGLLTIAALTLTAVGGKIIKPKPPVIIENPRSRFRFFK